MLTAIAALLKRDLATLEREIAAYPDDASLWTAVPGQRTSGGNLALHLVGNLRHFIGAGLGNTRYLRDRPQEFGRRGLSRAELIEGVRDTAREVETTLAAFDRTRLTEPFPLAVAGIHPITSTFLIHLCTHLTFHLGQLDYHRRAATGNPASVGPLPLDFMAQQAPPWL